MTAPNWFPGLLAWKPSHNRNVKDVCGDSWAPNIADVDSKTSLRITKHILDLLGVTRRVGADAVEAKEESRGKALESAVESELAARLPHLAPERPWEVLRGTEVRAFEQYRHLDELKRLLTEEPNLRVTLGTDYEIKPDVTVSHAVPGRPLHAVVSCKWTLRSDRAQNIRHEFNLLVRSRRGRTPHLVAVTAEPMPSRLASLTRGTGEIDAVYHTAYAELEAAVAIHGTKRHRGEISQLDHWKEMTGQGRLKDYNELIKDLIRT